MRIRKDQPFHAEHSFLQYRQYKWFRYGLQHLPLEKLKRGLTNCDVDGILNPRLVKANYVPGPAQPPDGTVPYDPRGAVLPDKGGKIH